MNSAVWPVADAVPNRRSQSSPLQRGACIAISTDDEVHQFLNRGLRSRPVEGDGTVLDKVDPIAHIEDLRVVMSKDDDRNLAFRLQALDDIEN